MLQLRLQINQLLHANWDDADWVAAIGQAFREAGGDGVVVSLSDASLAALLASKGLSGERKELAIPDVSIQGVVPSTGYADDPVNTVSGNFIEPEMDLVFGAPASGLRLSRCYNSVAQGAGVFGRGWASVLDQRLACGADRLEWVRADGRHVFFPPPSENLARAEHDNFWAGFEPAQRFAWIVEPELGRSVGARVLVVRDNALGRWVFSSDGVWLGAMNGDGSAVRVVRSAGEVCRVEHEFGRSISFEYANGLVVAALSSDGRRVGYEYDGDRLLARSSVFGLRRYVWDSDKRFVTSVVSEAGVAEVTNTYDDKGRVKAQVSEFGRTSRYAYLPGFVTEVADSDGQRANTWIADRYGHTIGVIDSDGARQSMAYDSHGNLVQLTERDGAVTVHVYDDHGRPVRTVLPSGGEITCGWDDQGRIRDVVLENGSATHFEYADDYCANPSVIADAVGGVTKLSWDRGLLKRVVDPTGVALAFEYDSFGELIAASNNAGHTSRFERDSAGRVTAIVTPSGAATKLRYNEQGLLAAREDAQGAVWRYSYDASGRLITLTDPYGAVASQSYGEHGKVEAITDPLGRITRQSFDDLGNLARQVLPDGAGIGFVFDALSRLREITDSAGGRWGFDYSKIGEIARIIDPSGVSASIELDASRVSQTVRDAKGLVTGAVSFDAYGRPVQASEPDGSASVITYDGAGLPVEILDPEGGLNLLRRDKAGRVVEHVSAAGYATSYSYNEIGLLCAVTDSAGGKVCFEYDADSHLVKRVNPDGSAAHFSYDNLGRLVRAVVPGQGMSLYEYDKCGRVVYAREPLTGERRFKYDAAGQLIAATNGIGGVTRYEYDLRGRVVKIIDPAGGVSIREYNQLDKITKMVDPLGRETSATYAASGRQLTQTSSSGVTLEFGYDTNGQRESIRANGRLLTKIERDLVARTLTILDCTNPLDPTPVRHTLAFDRLGHLIARETSTVNPDTSHRQAWSYDRDGRRTSYTGSDGKTIKYGYDKAGRIATIEHPGLDSITFEYDSAGHTVACIQGDTRFEFEYAAGELAARHTHKGGKETSTYFGRDEYGRLTKISHSSIPEAGRESRDGDRAASSSGGGGVTTIMYEYDQANQLVAAKEGTGSESHWEYDQAGRLCHARIGAVTYSYRYDTASQLLETSDGTGRQITYDYDGAGRRISSHANSGERNEWEWDERSWLKTATHTTASGQRSTTPIWVNALGETARIGDSPLSWDIAASIPSLTTIGQYRIVASMAGLSLAGMPPQSAPTPGLDPYAVTAFAGIPGLPAGIGLTNSANLTINGTQWLGVRLYDPQAASFLTHDPLPAPAGAIWESSPYNYLANNPINLSDPLGQAPITDTGVLDHFNKNRAGNVAGRLISWETLAGAVLTAGGVALIATGFGGPLGAALVGAGIDVLGQQMLGGSVDWVGVGIGAAVGLGAGKVLSVVGKGIMSSALGKNTVGRALNWASTKMAQAPKVLQKPLDHVAKLTLGFMKETTEGMIENPVIASAEYIRGKSDSDNLLEAAIEGFTDSLKPEQILGNAANSVIGTEVEAFGRRRFGDLYDINSPIAIGKDGVSQINEYLGDQQFGYDPRTSRIDGNRIYAMGDDYVSSGEVKSVSIGNVTKHTFTINYEYQASPDALMQTRKVTTFQFSK